MTNDQQRLDNLHRTNLLSVPEAQRPGDAAGKRLQGQVGAGRSHREGATQPQRPEGKNVCGGI